MKDRDAKPSGAPTVTETDPGEVRGAGRAAVPSKSARYDIEREHARGGLGRILFAHDTKLGREVAIKELLRDEPAHRERFLREAHLTAQLEHPGIVPVHDAGWWETGTPYYTMKMMTGRSLRDAIAETTNQSERLALLPRVIDVADAIAYATWLWHRSPGLEAGERDARGVWRNAGGGLGAGEGTGRGR